MGKPWTESQETAMSIGGKTLLVSAAAGSGKTSVLIERIIRMITDRNSPSDLSRMLIVTFTRAAASELKSRIAVALNHALAEYPGDPHLTKQLFYLGSAQISTIDSFFQTIAREYFDQLHLPATFRLADENELIPLSRDCLDGVIEEFYRRYNPESTGASAVEQIRDNAFAASMEHLMPRRNDGKLTETLYSFYRRFSSYPEGISLLRKNAEALARDAGTDFFRTSYGKIIRDHLDGLFCGVSEELSAIRTYLGTDRDTLLRLDPLVSSDEDYCKRMRSALSGEDYDAAKRAAESFVSGRFPTLKNVSEEVLRYKIWRNASLKKTVQKSLDLLAFPKEEIARQMRESAGLLSMLYELFSEYETRLESEKLSRGVLEFDDVRKKLYRLLVSEDGSATEAAKEILSRYDTVCIDEYQDVDRMQDAIFSAVGGNHRFMVGDIKQSIYGFRGSEPAIFAGYRKRMPSVRTPEAQNSEEVSVFMSENFRCDQPVIDFANHVCAFLFSACEESVGYRQEDDLICSKRADGQCREPSPVEVVVFERNPNKTADAEDAAERKSPDEAVWVASRISALLREDRLDDGKTIRPEDIAILVRTNDQAEPFRRELERAGIPTNVTASSDLSEEPLLIDLLNLLRVIDNPYRDIPFSEYLLSPFGGFTAEEVRRVRGDDSDHSLYDAFCAFADADESDELTEKVVGQLRWLELQRASAARQPADRFLHLLYREESIRSYASDPVFLFVYEEARKYQRIGWNGLYGFLDHLTRLLDGGKCSADGFRKPGSAVQIMTIHHSKGLEFPVVFLCGCGSAFSKKSQQGPLLYHRATGTGVKLYSRLTDERTDTAMTRAVRIAVDEEETEEAIRTLYVALTRARERLIVTGTVPGKWDKFRENASLIRRGDRQSILGCNNSLTWIQAALFTPMSKPGTIPCIFRKMSAEDVIPVLPATASENDAAPLPAKKPSPLSRSLADVREAWENYAYPLDYLRGLPTKAAASKLCSDLIDSLLSDEEETSLRAQISLMSEGDATFDGLLEANDKPEASEVGTATHALLQYCDFSRLCASGAEAERDRLVRDRFLSPRMAEIVNLSQLSAFCRSNLMEWILSAKEIRREQKFGLLLPMASFTADPDLAGSLRDEKLFVQGSIDLLLTMEDGSMTLVDYKTDSVSAGEFRDPALLIRNMERKHGNQLSCYAEAVRQLFGKRPDRICVYSLPYGSALPLTIPDIFGKMGEKDEKTT